MRHQDVWYSCDGCGNRLNEGFTEVRSVSNDIASTLPEQENQLCALCWLKVDEILSHQKRQKEHHQALLADAEAASYREWLDRNPAFDG